MTNHKLKKIVADIEACELARRLGIAEDDSALVWLYFGIRDGADVQPRETIDLQLKSDSLGASTCPAFLLEEIAAKLSGRMTVDFHYGSVTYCFRRSDGSIYEMAEFWHPKDNIRSSNAASAAMRILLRVKTGEGLSPEVKTS